MNGGREMDIGRGPTFAKRSGKIIDRCEIGQSMVELALVLPLFLTMVLAIVEIGRAFAAKQALTIAAREGTRVLVLPSGAGLTYASEAAVQTASLNKIRSYLASSGVGIGAETTVNLARIRAGNDGIYATADDPAPEIGYSQSGRGQRVGVIIEHRFESPVPLFVRMFESPAVAGAEPTPASSSIRMVATCYMDHE
jgi:Flp pilus assembly protein TadG